MTWQTEYQEICEVINQTPESLLKKNFLKKDILKTIKRVGKLDYQLFPPDFRWNLCAARLRMGRFKNWDGWEFRSDWSITFQGRNGFKMKVPKWFGQKIDKLIICGEQGVGDEILFASAVPELIKRLGYEKLEFQAYDRLQPIIERSFKIKTVQRQKLGQIEGKNVAVVALADLFMFYRKDPSHFPGKPYFKSDPILVEKYKEILSEYPKPHIGIGWRARHGDLDPKDLMFEDGTYINLQYLRHPDGNWEDAAPANVIDLGVNPLKDMEQHFALIAALDKVVTVTQTTVHECGSIGKECHAIRPAKGSGDVHNMLWYYGLGNIPMITYNSVNIWNTPQDYERHCRDQRIKSD